MNRKRRNYFMNQLVEQGYGINIPDVENYLITRAIDDFLRCGLLVPLSKSNDEVTK